jgi:hypothetical protein
LSSRWRVGMWDGPLGRRTGSLPCQAMPGAPEDVNPLQDLDLGDEPLAPKAPAAPPARRAPPSPQQAAPPGPPAPPPQEVLGNRPSSPAPGPAQPGAATGGLVPVAQVPPAAPRPSGDPFQEPPEPRPPRGIALDEKLEYFRSVLKLKEETLTRARSVYEQRDLEAARLREVAVALKAQLDEVLPARPAPVPPPGSSSSRRRSSRSGSWPMAPRARPRPSSSSVGASEADRRDLARALAEWRPSSRTEGRARRGEARLAALPRSWRR